MSRRSLYSLRIGLSFVNVELRAELLKRMERDQEVRRGMRPGLEEREEAKLIERLRKVDGDNTSWLRDVISTHGWPGITLVGEDGAHAAWLLVQHAPQNLQEQCLPLLERAVEQGEARKHDWAYLLDRVLMHRGEPQMFGTQFIVRGGTPTSHPIRDEETVDERRAELGLGSIAEHAKLLESPDDT